MNVWLFFKFFPLILLYRVLGLQELGDRLQLDVRRALVDSSNLGVSEEPVPVLVFVCDRGTCHVMDILLCWSFTDESHTTHPFNGQPAHATRDLGGIKLGHGSVLNKVLSGLFLACGVEDKSTRGGDFGVRLSHLMLHALEFTHELTKLLTVVPDISEAG
jgi:hypothetical protein